MTTQQLIEHTAKREPVSGEGVGHTPLQHLRRHIPVRSDRRLRHLGPNVTGEAKIGYFGVARLTEQNISWFQIAVDNVPLMHVLKAQGHFGRIKTHLRL